MVFRVDSRGWESVVVDGGRVGREGGRLRRTWYGRKGDDSVSERASVRGERGVSPVTLQPSCVRVEEGEERETGIPREGWRAAKAVGGAAAPGRQ